MYKHDFYLDVTDSCDMILRPTHAYYHQIQGVLHLSDADVCDLFVWTPHDSQIIRIERDPGWAVNLSKLEMFFSDVFMPYVLQHM